MAARTKRWKAVATYRYTHDKVVSEIGYFDEIAEVEAWIEGNYDFRGLESLVITYNLTNENLTLMEIAEADGLEHPFRLVEPATDVQ